MKKKDKSASPIHIGRHQSLAKGEPGASAVPAVNDFLLSLLGSQVAVAKLIGTGGEATCDEGVVLVTGRAYVTRTCVVPAAEVYYDNALRPGHGGPWVGEADKVSWRDASSGYDCIMLRDPYRGFLSGYVGIPCGHPLWGWEHGEVPTDIGPEVHGGLTYSGMCETGSGAATRVASAARRISRTSFVPLVRNQTGYASDNRIGNPHAWWFGFNCDHVHDLAAGDEARTADFKPLGVRQAYRDDGYVARETIALAAQLRAIADCEAPPPVVKCLPRPTGRAR